MGRVLAHQPAEVRFAEYMNGTARIVVSTTLGQPTWENSSLIDSAVPRRFAALKNQPGKDIVVNGSATLVRSLLADGLLDELALLVHPVVVGSGTRLLDGSLHTDLVLSGWKTFANGVVGLTYALTRT